jgi:subtilisin family serine protease
MIPVRSRGRSAARRRRAPRCPLLIELLETRTLLDAGLTGTLSAQALPTNPGSYDPGDILVQFRPGATAANAASFKLTGAESGTPEALGPGLWKVDLTKGVTVADALAIFRSDTRVQFAQPDYRIQVQTTPNDPFFTANELWGLNQIGAPAAWNTTTGSSNVIVAVIDTGIDHTHPDLAANIWTNPGPVAGDGIGNDIHGANFTSLTQTTGNVMDDNGHGTHVSGIIGAVGDNGIGVTGVDWHIKLMALKFLDANGSGSTSGAVRAIDYAIAHGASIINASWGGGGYDQALADAIGRARKAGVIFVAAAGNNGTNDDTTPFYPADYHSDNVVVVGADDSTDHPAWFSNYGPNTVDLYAPGVGIWSTTPNNTYSDFSGTSMATPYVTGALALLKSEHPDWNYHQLIERLKDTVDKLPQYSNVAWGGRLDLAAAIGTPPPVTPPVTPPMSAGPLAITGITPSGPAAGQVNQVLVTFNASINPNTLPPSAVTLYLPSHAAVTVTSVTAVPGSNNRQFVVSFPTESAPGAYHLMIASSVLDVSGNPLGQPFVGTFTNAAAIVTPPPATPPRSAVPLAVTGLTPSGPAAGQINQVLVTFNQSINPNTLPPSAVTLYLPSHAAVPASSVTAVAGSNNRQFVVGFPTQSAAGTYHLLIASSVQDVSGNPLGQPFVGTFTNAGATRLSLPSGSILDFPTTTSDGHALEAIFAGPLVPSLRGEDAGAALAQVVARKDGSPPDSGQSDRQLVDSVFTSSAPRQVLLTGGSSVFDSADGDTDAAFAEDWQDSDLV